ncbi:hypothetical protein V6N11_016479 [Hibiscus sabdariffa]|uniref:Uncharacterized protein n=1 Tax=Hibiscus sabdariffa TaxID=183260 RepID=A0ABR2TVN7_9ROSI
METPPQEINLISCEPLAHVSDIKLIRTDTTLDLSQKAEKGKNDLYLFLPAALGAIISSSISLVWLYSVVEDAAKVNFDPAGYGGVPRNQKVETAEFVMLHINFSRKKMEALLAIVGSLAAKAAEYIADPTAQQLSYIFKHKS